MSVNLPNVSQRGAGTLVASTGATTAVPNPISPTQGDLCIVVCYMEGNATLVTDIGDGWTILASGYDSANNFGIFMAGKVATNSSSMGTAGFQLPASIAFTIQTYTFYLPTYLKWDLGNTSKGDWTNASASATALGAPEVSPSYSSGMYFFGRGYNNGGTTTVCAVPGSCTEVFDTGQTSPPHGVVGNYLNATQVSAVRLASITSNLSVAKTKRAGLSVFIPIVQNVTPMCGRYLSSRRVG